MAHGIRLLALRRDIRKSYAKISHGELVNLWMDTPARTLQLCPLDTEYAAVPREVWNDVLQHCGIGRYSYQSEQRDCDDFAMALRGRVPLELGLNGVGIVMDWSGRHAYNALVYRDGKGLCRIGFIEPQADDPSGWWVKQPGRQGLYDMDHGLAVF